MLVFKLLVQNCDLKMLSISGACFQMRITNWAAEWEEREAQSRTGCLVRGKRVPQCRMTNRVADWGVSIRCCGSGWLMESNQ